MNTSRCLLAAVLGLLVLAGGCARKKPDLEGEIADSPISVAQFHQGPALTAEDCQRFAGRLETAAKSDKPEEMLALFDWEALFERGLGGLDLSKQESDSALEGMRESAGTTGFVKRVIEGVKEGGSYRLVRIHDKDGGKRLLFRLALDNGQGYHDLMLARRADDQIRVVDFYVMLSGEAMSTTLRRGFLTMIAQKNQGLVGKLLGRDKDLVKHLATQSRMTAAFREDNHQEVMRLFNTLPPSLQQQKPMHILRLQAAAALGEEPYRQALDDYEKQFPNDPSLDLICSDSLLLRKKYPEALAAVDRLDKAIGGDPFLDTVRAKIHLDDGKADRAREAAERALKALPDLQNPYWTMVTISLKEKDHAATAKWLTELDERFDLEFDDLEKVPDYADFVKSPEYKKWAADRKKDQ